MKQNKRSISNGIHPPPPAPLPPRRNNKPNVFASHINQIYIYIYYS